ncbi:hypothetical protein K438DRAFT_1780352 [Mycena galopus ATCC 62051]|nr:hypothetical protein K438DRAFT_1780352 [Mycena galopus ATCC 62051]
MWSSCVLSRGTAATAWCGRDWPRAGHRNCVARNAGTVIRSRCRVVCDFETPNPDRISTVEYDFVCQTKIYTLFTVKTDGPDGHGLIFGRTVNDKVHMVTVRKFTTVTVYGTVPSPRLADREKKGNGGVNGVVNFARMQAAMHSLRREHNAKVIFKSMESGAHHDWVSATSFDELVTKIDGWRGVVFKWMDEMRYTSGVQGFLDYRFDIIPGGWGAAASRQTCGRSLGPPPVLENLVGSVVFRHIT